MEAMCRECRRVTNVVHDQAQGDMVCTECGLVVEGKVVDETAEWRSFSNEGNSVDQTRVGGPTNELLSGSGLSTMLVGAKGDGDFGGKRGWSGVAGDPDRDLNAGFQAIGMLADRLELNDNIKMSAHEIFAKSREGGSSLRGRASEAFHAACIYIACRKFDKPQTFKGIAVHCSHSTNKKEIGRAVKLIVQQLEDGMGPAGALRPELFVRRFCAQLRNMDKKIVDAAMEIAQNCDAIDLRTSRAPTSKAAAAIYMVTQLKMVKDVTAQDIHGASGVAESTIKNTYKDLLPFAHRLIPSSFATKEEIDRLPNS